MSALTRALVLAAQHHAGQKDKGGNPYILHPLRIMLRASTEEERITALLHDIVEDTPLTLDDIKREGFDDKIVEAIDCLTRRQGETYDCFINRIKGNDLARRVKILDLEDNCDLSRIPNPTDVDKRRLEKYQKAISELKNHNLIN
jgi:hypothetical protein